jgi:hypothetical protein
MITNNNEFDLRAYQKLQTIHRILCVVIILFIIIVVLFNKRMAANVIAKNDNSLLYVALLATILFPISSNYVYHRRIQSIDLDEQVKYRFIKFKVATVVRYLWIAGAAVLNVMVWFFTANIQMAVALSFLLLILIIIRPVKAKVIRTLRMKNLKPK